MAQCLTQRKNASADLRQAWPKAWSSFAVARPLATSSSPVSMVRSTARSFASAFGKPWCAGTAPTGGSRSGPKVTSRRCGRRERRPNSRACCVRQASTGELPASTLPRKIYCGGNQPRLRLPRPRSDPAIARKRTAPSGIFDVRSIICFRLTNRE